MSDITLYLRPLFVTTCKERVPWVLRCALVGIRNTTALVTSKAVKGPTLLSAQKMSGTAFYLRSRFVTTCKECVLFELRCALVGIRSTTALVTSKAVKGPTLLSARASEGIRKNFYLK
ncbi:hypothetical protein V1478_014980 [Vespula squamosa]|uniref:Uncharacterized protein n=1 Tax=Vespula squamosa TaxID=30214 RepID=A0ABD2A4K0_VESSQ